MAPTGRQRHTRTRKGCLTCRTRKKKCDEVKPRCAGCRRNMLNCEWPPNPDDVGSDVFRGGVMGQHTHNAAGLPPSQVIRAQCQISPAMSVYHTESERACTLTPHSVTLLSHYLKETASNFAMARITNNPFVTVLLPLGHVDDLLMHGMLAMSGAHLITKEPDNLEIVTATRLHYSRLIGGLRAEFARLQDDDVETKERLLRVLLVACHYEAASGDTQGIIFNHLHASRHLIQSLLDYEAVDSSSHGINMESLGFSMELYTYLVFSNIVTPHGVAANRNLPLDTVMTLEDMEAFPTFGSLFAGSHELFGLIPQASLLASRRLSEEGISPAGAEPSAELRQLHEDLVNRLESWTMPEPKPEANSNDWEFMRCAGEAFRHGLHIYLRTALVGSTVTCEETIRAISEHVLEVFRLSRKVAMSDFVSTMMWPVTIAGSCVLNPEHQQLLLREMYNSWYSLGHVKVMADVLQLLWADPDPRAFGPYGLYLIMEKHKLSVAVA